MAERESTWAEEKTRDVKANKDLTINAGKKIIDKNCHAFGIIQNIVRQNARRQPTQRDVNGKRNSNNDGSSKPSLSNSDKIPIKAENSIVEQCKSKVNNFDQQDHIKLLQYHDSNGDESLDKNNSSFSSCEKNRSSTSYARTNSCDQSNKSCHFSNNGEREISHTNYQESNVSKTVYYKNVSDINFKHKSNASFRSNKSNQYNQTEKYPNSYRDKKHEQYANNPKKLLIASNSNLDVLKSEFVNKNINQLNGNDFGNYIFKPNNTDLKDDSKESDTLINSSEEKNSVSSCKPSYNSNYGGYREEINLTDDTKNNSNISYNVLPELSNKFPVSHKHVEITKNDKLLCSVDFNSEEQNEYLNHISNFFPSISSTDQYIKESNFPVPPLPPVLYNQYIADDSEPFIFPPIPAPHSRVSPVNSSAHTSGYISSNELGNSDCEKPFVGKSNLMENTNGYDAITLFLNELELDSTKLLQNTQKVIFDVNRVIRYYFNGNSVILYGSYLSELCVNNSNVNLALKSNQSPSNSFFLKIRKKLYEKLHNSGYYVDSYEDASNDRKVKISFSDQEFNTSCELVYAGKTVGKAIKMNNLLKTLCGYDTRVKTLIVASRIWAEACDIIDAETGKLHAIGHALMVVYFLQQIECPVLPIIDVSAENELPRLKQKNRASVGKLWLEFLKFYSEEFDFRNYIVCITEKQKITKKSKSWEYWIAIEDPFSQKNVAASVIKSDYANHIHSSFSASYEYFMSPTSNPDSDSDTGGSDTKGSDNNKTKKLQKYSFASCARLQECVPVCEECEDSGGVCGDCLKLSYVPQNMPEVSKESMKYVDTVIEEVFNINILSDDNIKGRIAFVKDLEHFVKERFPAAFLSLFGSSVNGFGFDCSDLDICMTMPTNSYYQKNQQRILRGLCSHLRYDVKKRYTNVFCLYRATIPLVKFSSSEMGWKCDISLRNVLAVHNSKLLNRYAAFDDRCRKLGCAMKLLTKKANIAECVFKSLSSYSYILMTIHYLQQVEPPVLPVFPVRHKEEFEKNLKVPTDVYKQNEWCSADISKLRYKYSGNCTNTSSVGELWIGLLDFYLNYDPERAITITQKEPLQTSELLRTARLFNIEDPFLEKKNLGCIVSQEKAFAIERILRNARILFGKEKPNDITDLKSHYFSSMNITGHYIKDMDCSFCGAYGHDKTSCNKMIFNRKSQKKFSSYPQRC